MRQESHQQQAPEVQGGGSHIHQQAALNQAAHTPPDIEQGVTFTGDMLPGVGSTWDGTSPPLPPQPVEINLCTRAAAAQAAGNHHSLQLTPPVDESDAVDACLVTSAIAGIKGIT
jgi:hypothetical protein